MGKINSLKNDHSFLFIVILFVSGLLFFFPYLGSVHLFDWDEINFAESAREMIVTHDYHLVQINYEPFWEKPPLFFWLQAGAMHLFGINEFAARFPNALFGIISLLSFFLIGRKHKSARFGFLWSLAYLGSFLPHLYFKSGIIDPVFNYFIFMGIYFMYRDITKEQWKWKYTFVILSGIFIGLATLTKGPVGLLVFLLVYFIYFLFKKFSSFPSFSRILIWLAFYIIVCLLWFGEEVAKNGLWFLQKFITYQIELFLEPVASHGEPFYYHFVVVFIGCFPISIIGLPILFGRIKDVKKEFPLIMKILFWTIMILFSLTTTKIVHYSSLTYMPLAFMAASYLDNLVQNKERINTAVLYGVILMGLIFSSLLALLPYLANHPQIIEPYIRDEYARANLNIKVEWQGWESLTGIFYFLLIILSAVFFAKKSNWKAITTLFYSTALCLFIYLITVVPKIEQYSQGPAIRFYQSLAGKDVYMWPVGFKSYAQYFYGQKPTEPKYGNNQLEYLLRGKIDRPAYFVVKINNKEFTDQCNDCTLIKQEGGFLFYERKPSE
ncbi:MAG: glycosyltransferase family 39 protein [Chitinophagaceae bacterium]|nr:glycosyltransferase family 39 protein [Chitinophagaceae bacterium]MCZ2397145.1 glycosyltransferase family 39 protein [Chitinophagales bacterium]